MSCRQKTTAPLMAPGGPAPANAVRDTTGAGPNMWADLANRMAFLDRMAEPAAPDRTPDLLIGIMAAQSGVARAQVEEDLDGWRKALVDIAARALRGVAAADQMVAFNAKVAALRRAAPRRAEDAAPDA